MRNILELLSIELPEEGKLIEEKNKVPFMADILYNDGGPESNSVSIEGKANFRIHNARTIRSFELPYISRENFYDNFPILTIEQEQETRDKKQEIISTYLSSARIKNIGMIKEKKRKTLKIEYDIEGPITQFQKFFNIKFIKWIKILLYIKGKDKILNRFYTLLSENMNIKKDQPRERCSNCNSLKYEFKIDKKDPRLKKDKNFIYGCPVCLLTLSTQLKNIEKEVESLKFDKPPKKLTDEQEHLLKRMDETLSRSIDLGEDTAILTLSYLRGKIFLQTEDYFEEGIDTMKKVHAITSDKENRKYQNISEEFHDNVITELSNAYQKKKQYDEALGVVQERFKFNETRKNVFKVVESLNSMAEILVQMDKYEDAEKHAKESLNIQSKMTMPGLLKEKEKTNAILRRISEAKENAVTREGPELDKKIP